MVIFFFFFFQAEDGIRDTSVTGVQTCALPISFLRWPRPHPRDQLIRFTHANNNSKTVGPGVGAGEIGRASCRERV